MTLNLSIDAVLNKEHFYRKIMERMCTKKPIPDHGHYNQETD